MNMNRITRNTTAALLAAIAMFAAGCASGPSWPRGMQASLWRQTSAEYQALCWQIYRQAWEKIDARAHDNTMTLVDGGQASVIDGPTGKPMAVVMDLDETVLDNGAYQTWLYREGKTWDQESWTNWMNEHPRTIGLVPGAREFIEKCESLGVRVVFISNRIEAERPGTVVTLRYHGIDLDGMDNPAALRMLLNTGDSDKTARRTSVAGKYRVIAYFGDQLTDFDQEFSASESGTIMGRRAQNILNRQKYGAEWFVLPNPCYGAWMDLVNPECPSASLEFQR